MKYLIVILLVLTLGCRNGNKDQTQGIGEQKVTTTVKKQRKNVAILIFEGVQIIDFTGPYEVFGQAGYHVYTVAEKREIVTTHMNLDVLPAYDFANYPKPDFVVIPGGGAPHRLPKEDPTIQWIISTSNTGEYVLSVCNGAFFLASAGLLNDREATTYAPMINHIAMYAPDTKPVYDKRFVHSDNIITAGGLSAGIDASLYIVSLDKGVGRATEVANNMEYNWNPKSGYVRSQLADMQLLNVLDFNPPLFNRNVIRYEGDNTYWISEYEVTRKESLKEFYNQFDQAASMYKWNKENESITKNSILTNWTFADFNEKIWVCQTQFSKIDDKDGFRLFIELKRK